MTTKTLLIAGLIGAAACAAGVLIFKGQPTPQTTPRVALVQRDPDAQRPINQEPPALPQAQTPLPQPIAPAPIPQPIAAPATIEPPTVKPGIQPAPQDFGPAEVPVPEPLARIALSFVGADPEAEQMWVTAINDPNLSTHDRQNLIEDLNEDGFPDPKNITFDDLPLIVSRLQLIEELAPDAMDDANAAAFQEAYKDLINMYSRLMRQ